MGNDQLGAMSPDLDAKSGGEKIFRATQWQLVWWQFRKHKMALAGLVILIGMVI